MSVVLGGLRGAVQRAGWVLLFGPAVLGTGCAAPQPALRNDIVTVYHFYRLEPWIKDEEGRVAGLLARVYFVPAGGEKGVFVWGTIRAPLYVRTRRPDGTYERTLAHEWTFDAKQAEGFRIRKPSEMGESYGFVLRWPSELDLAGREVEIRFSYLRADDHLITGRATPLRVPAPAGTPPPRPWTTTAPEGRGAARAVPGGRPQSRPGPE